MSHLRAGKKVKTTGVTGTTENEPSTDSTTRKMTPAELELHVLETLDTELITALQKEM